MLAIKNQSSTNPLILEIHILSTWLRSLFSRSLITLFAGVRIYNAPAAPIVTLSAIGIGLPMWFYVSAVLLIISAHMVVTNCERRRRYENRDDKGHKKSHWQYRVQGDECMKLIIQSTSQ